MILDRDGWRLYRSARKAGRMEVDHIKPLDDGGQMPYDASNLQSLCASCHWEKSRSERRGREPDPEVAKWRKYLTNHYLLCMLGGFAYYIVCVLYLRLVNTPIPFP